MAKNIKKISTSQSINLKYLYKRLFKYTWQHKFILLLSIISLVILSLTNTAFLVIIKERNKKMKYNVSFYFNTNAKSEKQFNSYKSMNNWEKNEAVIIFGYNFYFRFCDS